METEDRRTPEEVALTVGFVVATDSFMSGWGDAPRHSYFAVPFRSWDHARVITENMQDRSEMKRIRTVDKDYRPSGEGVHLSICSLETAERVWLVPGQFLRQEADRRASGARR